MASIPFSRICASEHPPHIDPAALYISSIADAGVTKLRIATGGAGESGLLRALAVAFIDDHVKATKCDPFCVAWLKSDTAQSFNYLVAGAADVSITYHPAAEEIAESQGFVGRRVYGWRDHFMLVGRYLVSSSSSQRVWKEHEFGSWGVLRRDNRTEEQSRRITSRWQGR